MQQVTEKVVALVGKVVPCVIRAIMDWDTCRVLSHPVKQFPATFELGNHVCSHPFTTTFSSWQIPAVQSWSNSLRKLTESIVEIHNKWSCIFPNVLTLMDSRILRESNSLADVSSSVLLSQRRLEPQLQLFPKSKHRFIASHLTSDHSSHLSFLPLFYVF